MIKQGKIRVRTGCGTCKSVPASFPSARYPELTGYRIRKVKCDETKPSCLRCTSTGRKCDGYAPALQASALQLYRPGSSASAHDLRGLEGRALQFFREVVGPVLSGHADTYFWNQLLV